MALPDAATVHRARQQRLTAASLIAARSTWQRINANDLDGSWRTAGPRLFLLVTEMQRAAARDAIDYVPRVLAEQNIDVNPDGSIRTTQLAGVASDGRPLDSLLYEPVIRTKQLIGEGRGAREAAASGLTALERIIETQIADAGRAAAGIGVTIRPNVGYVRQLVTPSCPRCVVLAGKWYRWNQGFLRHPRCDCRHIPTTENVAGDLTTDPRKAIEQGQVRGLSKADTKAILEDGADVGQVINAHRGIQSAGTTLEGTTRRAFAARRMRDAGDTFQGARTGRYRRTTQVRLRPEAIYRQASSRTEAVELLRRYGYVV